MSEESNEFDKQLKEEEIEYPTSREYHEEEYRAGIL